MYSEKQKEIFQQFYEECKAKGFNPTKSEADKQRALLLAKENVDLVKIFGAELDRRCLEAYRMGKEYLEAKEAAEKKAAEEAKIAAQRKLDERAAALERELSEKRGRDKRLFFYQKSTEEQQAELKAADNSYSNLARIWDSMNKMEMQKESSWGTQGGIAAGITGSTAVGAVVAADVMSKNAAILANNEAIKDRNFKQLQPLLDEALARSRAARDNMKEIQEKADKVKLHLTEDRPVEDLMNILSFGAPQITFTKGRTMLLQVAVSTNAEYQITGNVPAVIDGSFAAEIYAGKQRIGRAYLNLPRHGMEKTATLKGHCLEAKPDTEYTVCIIPVALWLIEKYGETPIHYRVSYGRNAANCTYEITDLDHLVPSYQAKHSWTPISRQNITWQQRCAEIKDEEARKAEEARQKAEQERIAAAERKAKNKKMAIIAGAVAVVGIVATVVMTQVVIPGSRYKNAKALMVAGNYGEAIAAFEALGDYKDSADMIADATVAYAETLVEADKLDEALEVLGSGAEEFFKSHPDLSYSVATKAADDGDWLRARQYFERCSNYQDASQYAAYVVGREALEEEHYDEAIQNFEKIDDMNFLDTRGQLGNAYYLRVTSGDYPLSDAIAQLEKAIEIAPDAEFVQDAKNLLDILKKLDAIKGTYVCYKSERYHYTRPDDKDTVLSNIGDTTEVDFVLSRGDAYMHTRGDLYALRKFDCAVPLSVVSGELPYVISEYISGKGTYSFSFSGTEAFFTASEGPDTHEYSFRKS